MRRCGAFERPRPTDSSSGFFRSLREECVWQHNFGDFAEARSAITQWIEWYDAKRPQQALGYRSPRLVPWATTSTCGLIQGEHYTVLLTRLGLIERWMTGSVRRRRKTRGAASQALLLPRTDKHDIFPTIASHEVIATDGVL